MDNIQRSLSKLKKGFKHRLGGKKRGADRAAANAAGETASSSPSLTRSDFRVTASVRDEEGDGISTDDSQAHSRDRSPHPKPMHADEGGDNPQEADGTWALSPQQLRLITLSDNTDTPAVQGHVQGDPRPDESAELSAVTNEKKSSWKSTAFATAKLLLRGVRDSADAFGPLKSVAGGLCFILENCEVWGHPCVHYLNSDRYPSE